MASSSLKTSRMWMYTPKTKMMISKSHGSPFPRVHFQVPCLFWGNLRGVLVFVTYQVQITMNHSPSINGQAKRDSLKHSHSYRLARRARSAWFPANSPISQAPATICGKNWVETMNIKQPPRSLTVHHVHPWKWTFPKGKDRLPNHPFPRGPSCLNFGGCN